MADVAVSDGYRLVFPEGMYAQLLAHLFPGDGDEHGAVIVAGLAHGPRGTRLLARRLHLAVDGHDYVPGKRGYRMLKAEFVRDRILECADERLVYLAVHNHGGTDRVGFSNDDLRSHERGYPALLDIANGLPVGALVFAEHAVAGDIWLPGGGRLILHGATITGRNITRLTASPVAPAQPRDARYDRQARLFGDAGQDILRQAKVAVIGLGGIGALVAEYLGHLGVGHLVLIDPDRIAVSNLPRVVGATRLDALAWLADEARPARLRAFARRLATPKVRIARRVIRRANPSARVDALFADALQAEVAGQLVDCDYIFLAADTMRARLLFNAIVHQYLVPGVQLGAKVLVEKVSGKVLDAYSVVRPVVPGEGCLWCNGLINPAKLQEEGQREEELRAQRYVDEPDIIAPSVITLNAVAASQGVNDFLFTMTGMTDQEATTDFRRYRGPQREVWSDEPRRSPDCPECSSRTKGRLGQGDGRRLPTRAPRPPRG